MTAATSPTKDEIISSLNDGFLAPLHRNVCKPFKVIFALLCLWVFPVHAHTNPIITLSVGKGDSCHTAYEIAIYEDGKVTYDGYNKVIVKGHRETKIKPKIFTSLIDKFEEKDFMSLNQFHLAPGRWLRPQISISMRQGERVVNVGYGPDFKIIEYLMREIILATRAKRWIYDEIDTCYEK